MSDLKNVVERILELASRAVARPWMTRPISPEVPEHCEIYEPTSSVEEILARGYIPECEYMTYTANTTEILARDWLLQESVIEAVKEVQRITGKDVNPALEAARLAAFDALYELVVPALAKLDAYRQTGDDK